MKVAENVKKIGEVKKEELQYYKIISKITFYMLCISVSLKVVSIIYKWFVEIPKPYSLILFAVYFLLIFVAETIIHESSHWLSIKLSKGKPKIAWPQLYKCGNKFYQWNIKNPQAYDTSEENRYFSRNEYVVCLMMPLMVIAPFLIVPFYAVTHELLWTLIGLSLLISGMSIDIPETINLMMNYDKEALVKMRLGEVRGQERCIGIEIYKDDRKDLKMNDIAILTNQDGYEKLLNVKLLNENAELIKIDLSKKPIYRGDEPVTVEGYEYVFKLNIWSVDGKDVKEVYAALSNLVNKNIPYQYIRIGDELDDYEREIFDRDEKLLTQLSIKRTIEIE